MSSAGSHFFEEGQEYEFIVHSRVQMPPDDETYFVLISLFQTRHLLQEKHYVNYGILPGQRIKCHIDKINCSGKIYLEPEHPLYKEGSIYIFPVQRMQTITNSDGKPENMLVLKDCWNNEIYINAPAGNNLQPKNIKCRVDRIKKSKLYLTPLDKIKNEEVYEIGKEYIFTVEGIVTLAENEEYYVLKDEANHIHHLRKKYFEHYGFIRGGKVYAHFLSQPTPFRHYLEPRNPFYLRGNSYEFIFSGTESYINESGREIKKILVTDGTKGKEYFVTCNDESVYNLEKGNKIRCRLKDIRMGRLVLECA